MIKSTWYINPIICLIGGILYMELISKIKACIEKQLNIGKKKFIIYPFGDVGIQVKQVLNMCYGIHEEYIIDNNLCKYNSKIKDVSFLKKIDCSNYVVILASINDTIYSDIKASVAKYFNKDNIAEFFVIPPINLWHTDIGKHSYGPICYNHAFIKSIGSFCSFASGVDVAENHPMNYITTHPMLYMGRQFEDIKIDYIEYKEIELYFEGVQPKDFVPKMKRCNIGNDVWLGKNVIITNGANIGNGVIAGANSVITKDIPDYAVVVGAPARIIRYRFSPEQIEGLNKIAWWDWSDEEIRDRYDDFYLPVDDFLKKYLR